MHYLTLLALALSASAIKLTSPTKDQTIDLSQPFTVTWETVASDPASAHLFLVNMASGNTPYSKDLGEIDLSKGSATVSVTDVPEDKGFQFNMQSVQKENMGILAQSEQFVVEAEEEKEDKTTAKGDETKTLTSAVAEKSSGVVVVSQEGGVQTTFVASTTSAAGASGSASGSKTAKATADASSVPESGAAKLVGGSMLAFVVGLAAVVV